MPSATSTPASDKAVQRLSVSLSPEQYAELFHLVKKNKVLSVWFMREAIDRMLRDELQLFHGGGEPQ